MEDVPFVGMIQQCEIPVLDDVVWTQNLLPAKFADIRIPLINLGDEVRIIPRGTCLGRLYEAEVVTIPEDDEENEVAKHGASRRIHQIRRIRQIRLLLSTGLSENLRLLDGLRQNAKD